MPDQKTERIVQILVDEVVPFFGVPEALLSDRGTNFLSHLMKDMCNLLGIEKLNTTAYHPQCDGLTERFNRTLKTMLRKHAVRYGPHTDLSVPPYYGHTATPHASPRKRSLRSSCLELIYNLLLKLPSSHLLNSSLLQLKDIEKN